MSKFRIRPVKTDSNRLLFILEELEQRFFRKDRWRRRAFELADTDGGPDWAIKTLRAKHAELIKERLAAQAHLATPIIYLEDPSQ